MDGYIKLAKEIYKRNNKKQIGVCVGEVASLTPVTIRIYYKGEPLNFDEFFNVEGLINGNTGATSEKLYVSEYPVKVGDKFICIAGNDNQSLYVIGKLESINELYIYLE